ncbi:MAG: hypothetical protein PVSMB1_18480 [Gemmatimonadaceae bacterium]
MFQGRVVCASCARDPGTLKNLWIHVSAAKDDSWGLALGPPNGTSPRRACTDKS